MCRCSPGKNRAERMCLYSPGKYRTEIEGVCIRQVKGGEKVLVFDR